MTNVDRQRRVLELCDIALTRDARERAAFVAAACGSDGSLRLEVEALLARARSAEAFLAAPMGEVAANILGDADGASLVGRQIGSYKILSLLGAGGMGEVYRARDTVWAAMSPSRSCQTPSSQTRSGSCASNARRGCWRR